MVIYGYGSDINEQDELEEISFKNAWKSEQNRIYRTLGGKDRETLTCIYEKTSHEKVPYYPWEFVNEISWRVYTEACMNQEEKFNPDKYNGEAFRKFVDDETHYAIERALKDGLIQDSVTEKTYSDIRYKVLTGLVEKSVEFFSESKREGNLRCDIRRYIRF